jgi:MoxR-like ATPase
MANLAIERNEVSLDGLMAPPDKLRRARQLEQSTENEHGMEYLASHNGAARVAIKSVYDETIVKVPTKLTEEQFKTLLSGILPLPETREILFALAQAYERRTPIMLEGGTAIGKTFVVERFAEILYGLGAKIPDFYCSGQTDVGELMGRHVPAGLRPEQIATIHKFLGTDAGAALKAELNKNGVVSAQDLIEHAAHALKMPIQRGSFTFQLGVLPRAMTGTMGQDGPMQDTPDGPGCLLHIQEVGLATPAVINALLKIRAGFCKLARTIEVQEDKGRLITAGEGFFVVFSTNPPGKGFKERFEMDNALTRGLAWKSLPDALSDSSMRFATERIFDFSRIDRDPTAVGSIIDLRAHRELAQWLGEVAVEFHLLCQEKLRDGESGRRQRIPITMSSLARVAELVQNYQIPSRSKEGVDFLATLKSAIRGVYIDALQDKPDLVERAQLSAQAKQRMSLGQALLDSIDAILEDRTREFEFRGFMRTRGEIIQQLSDEAYESYLPSVASKTDMTAQAEEVRARIDIEGDFKKLTELLGDEAVSQLRSKISG